MPTKKTPDTKPAADTASDPTAAPGSQQGIDHNPPPGSPSTLDTDNPHFHQFTKRITNARPGQPNRECNVDGCHARARITTR